MEKHTRISSKCSTCQFLFARNEIAIVFVHNWFVYLVHRQCYSRTQYRHQAEVMGTVRVLRGQEYGIM